MAHCHSQGEDRRFRNQLISDRLPEKPAAGLHSPTGCQASNARTIDGYGEELSTDKSRIRIVSDQSEERDELVALHGVLEHEHYQAAGKPERHAARMHATPHGHISNRRSMERCRQDSAREIEIQTRYNSLCDQSDEREERGVHTSQRKQKKKTFEY